jgi:hypothetical protein
MSSNSVIAEEGRISREIRDNGLPSVAEGISGIATKTPFFISKLWVRARLTSYADHSSSKLVTILEHEAIEDRKEKLAEEKHSMKSVVVVSWEVDASDPWLDRLLGRTSALFLASANDWSVASGSTSQDDGQSRSAATNAIAMSFSSI